MCLDTFGDLPVTTVLPSRGFDIKKSNGENQKG